MAKSKTAAKRTASPTRLVHETDFRQAVFSPRGDVFALAAHDSPLLVCDAATGETVREISVKPRGIAFTPDGSKLLVGVAKGAVLYDVATGKKGLALAGHKQAVHSVDVSADGTKLLTGAGEHKTTAEHTARVWDASSGAEIAKLTLRNPAHLVRFSPDGRTVAVASNTEVVLWDFAQGDHTRRVSFPTGAHELVFTPDGSQLVVQSSGGTVCYVDIERAVVTSWWAGDGWRDGAPAQHDGLAVGACALALSPAGDRIAIAQAVARPEKRGITLMNTATREVTAFARCADGITVALAFSPDGARLVAAGTDRTAQIYSAEDGSVLVRPEVRPPDALERFYTGHALMFVALGPAHWKTALGALASSELLKQMRAAWLAGRIAAITGAPLASIEEGLVARLRALADDPEHTGRTQALDALSSDPAETEATVPLLERAFDAPDEHVRASAASHYAKLRYTGARALELSKKLLASDLPAMRTDGAASVLGDEDEALATLWDATRDDEHKVRWTAGKNLLDRGVKALAGALDHHASKSAFERTAAARIIGAFADAPGCRDAVASLLGDADPDVREAITTALLEAKSVTAREVPLLADVVRTGGIADRPSAAKALLESGPEGVAALDAVLEQTDPAHRVDMVLQVLMVKGAGQVALSWVRRADATVHRAVVERGYEPDAGPVLRPWLEEMTKSKDKAIKMNAKWRLEQLE